MFKKGDLVQLNGGEVLTVLAVNSLTYDLGFSDTEGVCFAIGKKKAEEELSYYHKMISFKKQLPTIDDADKNGCILICDSITGSRFVSEWDVYTKNKPLGMSLLFWCKTKLWDFKNTLRDSCHGCEHLITVRKVAFGKKEACSAYCKKTGVHDISFDKKAEDLLTPFYFKGKPCHDI